MAITQRQDERAASVSSKIATSGSASSTSKGEDYSEKEREDDFAHEGRSVTAGDDDIYAATDDGDVEAATAMPLEQRSTKISVNNIASVPNGGLRAWLQVLGAFFVFFNTWGLINTFGVYQTLYELEVLPSSSPSSISWIGSIESFLPMIVSALTGPVYDAGYFRELLWGGSFLVVFGHMMLSLCKVYWQFLLAQAFCIGLGAGLLFTPGVAILSTYWSTRLAFATGVAATGSSLGGVLYPIMLNRLVPEVGFPWAVRIIGFLCLATLAVPLTFMKVRVLPAQKRPLVDWSAFRELPWVLYVTGSFVCFTGLYTLFFYVQSYAIDKQVMSEDLAFYLISILNAASFFGRLFPNIAADHIGPLNTLIPSAVMTGILILTMIAANSAWAIILITCLFGFFSGTFVSLPPTIIVHMTKNRGLIGTRLGMTFAFTGVGILIGAPIDGVIEVSKGYTSMWLFGGLVVLSGSALIACSRVLFKGWKLNVRA